MKRHSRRATIAAVLAQPAAPREIARLSRRTGRPHTDVHRELRQCLREMAAGHGRRWTRAFGRIMEWLLTDTWEVHCPEPQRETVRRLAAGGGVVFLPCHRAHTDPLFLSRALRGCGLPRNLWIAGDNLRVPVLASPARRAGVLFLRRRCATDEVYRTALRLYLRYLLERGQPVEWYQEGSRSRNGLIQPPRHGLLTDTLAALRRDTAPRVWFVPVSLTHTPVPDAVELAAEEDGLPKRPESLRWFLRYVREHRGAAGRVEVRFGTPLEAGPYVEAAEDDPGTAARTLGQDVNRALCRSAPVTAEALTAFAVAAGRTGGSVRDVHHRLQPLLDTVARSDAPTAGVEVLRDTEGVRVTLHRLRAAGAVSMTADGDEAVFHAVRRITAMYGNQCVHWLWPRAVAEVAALRACTVPPSFAWMNAVQRLRSLVELVTCGTGLGTDPFLLATAVVELERLTAPCDDPEAPWTFRAGLPGAGALIAPDVLRGPVTVQLAAFRRLGLRPRGRDLPGAPAPDTSPPGGRAESDSPRLYRAMLLDAERQGFGGMGREKALRRAGRTVRLRELLDDLAALERLADEPVNGDGGRR
ncbi:1-acyl-sn-glycerol-3-phosphate acyltransferase [Streptomyces gobitricini]|uniref:Phospholipid/glycerol acyltransferase domain-containing protein n=1 Tax=Streptomyces gobitricini TaxID=68211 RepID=A0ABP6ADV2_9ACTN